MMDFSSVLLSKIDRIVDQWVEAVRQDGQIETAKHLTYNAVRDSVPIVLRAIAHMLSTTDDDGEDIKVLVNNSLEHGVLRAKQGYDAEEIAREYRVLRWVLFSALEPDLLKGSSVEVIRAVRLIDTALDEVIARCFKSYTEARLSELEELQSQLQLTNQELTRLVRASKENLSQLAHELKTPLTSIIGYSDLFLRQQRQNSEVKDTLPNVGHIERVLNSGRQLLHLINDALEISRYEEGKMKLQATPTNVQEVVENVIEMLEPLASAKELQFLLDCDRAPEQVLTDCLRLQQIITNLVSNAVRYTESGCIKVICEQLSEEEWCIAIADTGVGIEEENREHIFEPYFRVVASDRSFLPNSTGLGLAIVSRLVNLLQGKIKLSSEVGTGSTFTVILPVQLELTVDS